MSKRFWLPTRKGIDLFPSATRTPTTLRIKDVHPGTELYTLVAAEYDGSLRQFHAKAQYTHALSVNSITKVRQQFGDEARVTYTNIHGNEVLELEVSRSKLERFVKVTDYPPERDIELRGYIAIHNANTANSDPERNSEAVFRCGLAVNGHDLGPANFGEHAATIYTFGGYKPNYHSWNDDVNPNGHVGVANPVYPGDEIYSRKYYPMYGFERDPPTGTAFEAVNFPNLEANGFVFPYHTIAVTNYVDCTADVLNLFGTNDVMVYQTAPDPNNFEDIYGWVYAEFFGRYAREVTVSWRFPFAANNGVPRKILTNDDPWFWFSEIGGLPIQDPDTGLWGVGALSLDLSPPFILSENFDHIIDMNDVLPSAKADQTFDGVFPPDGYTIGLKDPWP